MITDRRINIPMTAQPRVVIIGGGFAGMRLAKELNHSQYQVVLIDKNNYHTFQPLLYQVATGGLEPDAIATPFRKIFESYNNIIFRMAEVYEVIPKANLLLTSIGRIEYTYLIIATGSTTNYFGMTDVKFNSLPLKTIPDALDMRSKILQNFEMAVDSNDEQEQDALIDVVVVGGGPTGVEMAGALAELKNNVLPGDYAEIDFNRMDVYLVEMGPRLLSGMSEESSHKTLKFLEEMGVHVWLNTSLETYDGKKAKFSNGKELFTSSLIYSAGVSGNALKGLSNDPVTRANRIEVNQHLQVKGNENVFAIGDVAAMVTADHPKPHAMIAPAAIQQGEYVAKFLKCNRSSSMKGFVYNDKGSMATIGRNKAVVDFSLMRFHGVFAWFVWMFVHLMSIVGFRSRIAVFVNWAFSYFTYDKRFRLIIRPYEQKNRRQTNF